jgi:hypothetical protein
MRRRKTPRPLQAPPPRAPTRTAQRDDAEAHATALAYALHARDAVSLALRGSAQHLAEDIADRSQLRVSGRL